MSNIRPFVTFISVILGFSFAMGLAKDGWSPYVASRHFMQAPKNYEELWPNRDSLMAEISKPIEETKVNGLPFVEMRDDAWDNPDAIPVDFLEQQLIQTFNNIRLTTFNGYEIEYSATGWTEINGQKLFFYKAYSQYERYQYVCLDPLDQPYPATLLIFWDCAGCGLVWFEIDGDEIYVFYAKEDSACMISVMPYMLLQNKASRFRIITLK